MNIGEKIENNMQKIILAGILVMIGVIGRVVLHDFFNSIANPWAEFGYLDVFFVIAAVSIFSGILLGKYYVFIVPICVVAITDVFYALVDPANAGAAHWTSWLFLFTGSGYVFMALIGFYTKKKSKLNMMFIPKIFGAGILGIIIYDLWTNFGFWLTYSKLGWYPATFEGLVTVYSGGLPFMLWHIISASIAIAVIAVPVVYLKEHKIISSEIILKPFEKYTIAGATLALIVLSIISAIL